MTLLPDIIENPEPLPDKRGTLGIFQFPWGEKSDTASIQPRPAMYMAMPGTMTSGASSANAAVDARSRQLEQSEYSSSFFDDYDEDEDGGSDYDDGDGSDDGFDETTLWEIASLLKTDSVPSKDSLFPPPLTRSVTDDYMNDIPSDDESDSSREQSIMIGLAEEQPTVPLDQLARADARDSQLWNAEPVDEKGSRAKGLPHPSDKTWAAYNGVTETSRAKPRKAEPTVIESEDLWAPEEAIEASDKSPMWSGQPKPSMIPRPVPPQPKASAAPVASSEPKPSLIPRLTANPGEIKKARKNRKQVTKGLWDAPAESGVGEEGSMFVVDAKRGNFRSTTEEPAAKVMDRKSRRVENKPLEQLSSAGMWNRTNNPRINFGEMSHGMWNPTVSQKSGEAVGNGMFKVDRTRPVIRTTSKEPAAETMERKSRPRESKPLDKLESTSMWSPDASGPSEHDWMSGKVTSARLKSKGPLRHQYRRPAAYRSDWEAALKEGYRKELSRIYGCP